MTSLTSADVARLLQDPSSAHRAETAVKVSSEFTSGTLSNEERAIAVDIFKIMVEDAEVRVRQALSESLKSNPDIPHDVALTLAKDVEDVARPILEYSEVLTNDDLIDIVRTQDEGHQVAIAKRNAVSEKVSDALVDTQQELVVATLVANQGADMSEDTMNRVLDDFGENENVNGALTLRENLPLRVAERLVTLVSDELRDRLLTNQELSPDVASDLILESREKATVTLLTPGVAIRDVRELVQQLFENDRLTPTLIVRAMCMGDVTFFEAALARRADIPIANAFLLVHDRGRLGLERLFDKADMPTSMLPLARAALSVAGEMTITSGDDRVQFRTMMIERLLTRFEDAFDPENLDYFIGKLGVEPLEPVAA